MSSETNDPASTDTTGGQQNPKPPPPLAKILPGSGEGNLTKEIQPPGGGTPGAVPGKNAAADVPMKPDTETAKELTNLSREVDDYYDSCRQRARRWMILFVLFVGFELFLLTALILSSIISYQGEILTPSNSGEFVNKVFTLENVKILLWTIFILTLFIMWAARFKTRWKLNQGTVGKLADLKIDLTASAKDPASVRDTLKKTIEHHNKLLEDQGLFTGTKERPAKPPPPIRQ